MGGVARHHGAQQPEEHLANLNEGSAACSLSSASHYSVARPRQELNYTTKVPIPVQFWRRSNDTKIIRLQVTEVYNFQACCIHHECCSSHEANAIRLLTQWCDTKKAYEEDVASLR